MHRCEFLHVRIGNEEVQRLRLIDKCAAISCHVDDRLLFGFPDRFVYFLEVGGNAVDALNRSSFGYELISHLTQYHEWTNMGYVKLQTSLVHKLRDVRSESRCGLITINSPARTRRTYMLLNTDYYAKPMLRIVRKLPPRIRFKALIVAEYLSRRGRRHGRHEKTVS